MQTVTVRLNNPKTLKLLEDLEAMNLLQVVDKTNLKRKKTALKADKKIEAEAIEPKHSTLKDLLLTGPIFTRKQIKAIEDTHKSINEWRTK